MIGSLKRMTIKLCMMTASEVFSYLQDKHGFTIYIDAKTGQRFAYRPGDSSESVMLVCHADTVLKDTRKPKVTRNVIRTPELDDRLGIAAMLTGHKFTVGSKGRLSKCAMLICDDEEVGDSTAALFQSFFPSATPNWLVELDRRGTDVVTYDYGNETWHSLLQSVGYSIGQGSFSDICHLEGLGVCGVNVGVGYHNEHTFNCYANLSDTAKQLTRLDNLLSAFGHIRLRHDIPAGGYYSGKYESVGGNLTTFESAYVGESYCFDCNTPITDDDVVIYSRYEIRRKCFDKWAIHGEI